VNNIHNMSLAQVVSVAQQHVTPRSRKEAQVIDQRLTQKEFKKKRTWTGEKKSKFNEDYVPPNYRDYN
jgi:hypothetical protein